jgi:hypothetical protein
MTEALMTSRTLVRWTCAFGIAFSLAVLPAAVRAADAAGSSPLFTPLVDDAPTCRIDDPEGRFQRIDTSAQIAQIRAMIAADTAAAGGPEADGGVVVLNNRGYNYDAGTIVDPRLIEFEAQRLGR